MSERIHRVLLSDRRSSVPQSAAIFACAETRVRDWLARFEAEGLAGLSDRPRVGRPPQADTAARELRRHELEATPAAAGYLCGGWTVVTLAAHLAERCGLALSHASVRRLLWALTYRWRRPRHCLPSDPAAAGKLWALCARIVRAPADAVVLCQDACDLHLLPVLPAMWMRRGQHVRVPTPGTNRKRAVFGALEWETGRWLYAINERKRAVEFLACLEDLLAAYPGRPLLVVLDHASIHTARALGAWLAAHPSLALLYLPTYSGHAENPVEKVWWRLKGQVAVNRLYGSLDALVAAADAFFASFTPEDASRLAA